MTTAESDRLGYVARVLECAAFHTTSEAELQAALSKVLHDAGIAHRREVTIGADRFDFVIGDGLVVEVKIAGSLPALTRQVHRYAAHAHVTGILVVTTQRRLATGLPTTLRGKPVVVALLASSL